MADIAAHLDQQGFCLVEHVLGNSHVQALRDWSQQAHLARSERGGETYGARNLLGFPLIRATAALPSVASCLLPILGEGFRAVRGLFFDKTLGANWPVAWHQDLSLAIRQRHDLAGWSNWSVKGGVPHVQPPPDILARMVTLRLHLDDCPADHGALRVLPGSHRHGLLPRDAAAILARERATTIPARAGDGLLMKPLLLHASSPAQTPSHRRVLHLEFSPEGLLPAPLQWAEG
jgi:ectoine hydroxylase-related dioxygenase (phytanoyl-CoA dioxygenase family)